jgi:hypothetical protein
MYQKGLFGNRIATWTSINDFYKSGYNGKVTLRDKNQQGGLCQYNVDSKDVPKSDSIVINISAPDEFLLFQGEITRSKDYLYLFASCEKTKMRDALKSAIGFTGLDVVRLLKMSMTPSSYDDLQDLFELYPDSIIELGVYSINVGLLPHRNTLIWEVRNY